MLPPILEIYLLWHPQDREAEKLAITVAEHFHGNSYCGLLDGAMEVYIRSTGWGDNDSPPRPISLPGQTTNSVAAARNVAIVPCMGREMQKAVQNTAAWRDYMQLLLDAHNRKGSGVKIFPMRMTNFNGNGSWLNQNIESIQGLASANPNAAKEDRDSMMCRDLAQGLTQWLSEKQQLTVFISHTKRAGVAEEKLGELIEQTRRLISDTRLSTFFDAQDLQPGSDWSQKLTDNAQTCAMLAIRSDLYATRMWCQREMLTAKTHDVPIVILNVLHKREERGSFLMDHVPRISIRQRAEAELKGSETAWRNEDILSALNLLVDVCLQRVLWQLQAKYTREDFARKQYHISWWAAHAPEPTTFSHWLSLQNWEQTEQWPGGLRILHPDPPLGADEIQVLDQIAKLAGLKGKLEVTTPRTLAARGI